MGLMKSDQNKWLITLTVRYPFSISTTVYQQLPDKSCLPTSTVLCFLSLASWNGQNGGCWRPDFKVDWIKGVAKHPLR